MMKSPSGCRFEACTLTRTVAGGSPSSRPSIRDPGGDGTVERKTIASAATVGDTSRPALRPVHVRRGHRRVPSRAATRASRSASRFAMSARLS